MYQLIENSTNVKHLPSGTVFPMPAVESFGFAYQAWLDAGNVPELAGQEAIESRRAAVWEKIKARREALKSGGVKVGAHWFHSDADSRIQQLGLVIMSANMPAGLKWKTIDNGLVDMTPTLAQQIFATTANWDATVFGVAEVHRAAVMASDNPESYDWSAGWPVGYQGEVSE